MIYFISMCTYRSKASVIEYGIEISNGDAFVVTGEVVYKAG